MTCSLCVCGGGGGGGGDYVSAFQTQYKDNTSIIET